MGWIPGPRIPHAAEQLSPCATLLRLCSRVWELQLLSPRATVLKPECPGACALQKEKPFQGEACVSQLERSPRSPQLEQRLHSNEDPVEPKIKISKIINKEIFKD